MENEFDKYNIFGNWEGNHVHNAFDNIIIHSMFSFDIIMRFSASIVMGTIVWWLYTDYIMSMPQSSFTDTFHPSLEEFDTNGYKCSNDTFNIIDYIEWEINTNLAMQKWRILNNEMYMGKKWVPLIEPAYRSGIWKRSLIYCSRDHCESMHNFHVESDTHRRLPNVQKNQTHVPKIMSRGYTTNAHIIYCEEKNSGVLNRGPNWMGDIRWPTKCIVHYESYGDLYGLSRRFLKINDAATCRMFMQIEEVCSGTYKICKE